MELTGREAAPERARQERLEEAGAAQEQTAPAAQATAAGQRRTPGGVCPYCGGALLEGSVRSRDKLSWNGQAGTADLDFQGWFLPKARAWLCPACGIVLLRTRD